MPPPPPPPAGSGLDDQTTDTVWSLWCVCVELGHRPQKHLGVPSQPIRRRLLWRFRFGPPLSFFNRLSTTEFRFYLHAWPARFLLGHEPLPPPLSRFATQRRCHRSFLGQRPARRCALVPATTKRLSHRRSAANATPAARLPPPKRPPLIPTSVHASASCIFGCFHGAPPPAPNHGLGFCGSGFWRLPPSFSTPCLSQRHCRLQ